MLMTSEFSHRILDKLEFVLPQPMKGVSKSLVQEQVDKEIISSRENLRKLNGKKYSQPAFLNNKRRNSRNHSGNQMRRNSTIANFASKWDRSQTLTTLNWNPKKPSSPCIDEASS
jgi:hypothetical protein